MSAAQMDPHDQMRSRDISKVARGEQVPRPAHEYGTVSKPPPPQSSSGTAPPGQTNPSDVDPNRTGTGQDADKKKGEHVPECQMFAEYYPSLCPPEWIVKWKEQRDLGILPCPFVRMCP